MINESADSCRGCCVRGYCWHIQDNVATDCPCRMCLIKVVCYHDTCASYKEFQDEHNAKRHQKELADEYEKSEIEG